MPLELFVSLNTVAVRTPNIALGDFFHERLDRVALVLHFADIVLLNAANMVKIHDTRVVIATIYAGMLLKIIPNEPAYLLQHSRVSLVRLVNVILLVILVVTTAIFQVAFLARLLMFAATNTKHRQQAILAAFRAGHSVRRRRFFHEPALLLVIADCTQVVNGLSSKIILKIQGRVTAATLC